MAKQLNVNPDTQLNVEAKLFPLIKAIGRFEIGPLFNTVYDETDIQHGIALA